jgi:hypothetical protein
MGEIRNSEKLHKRLKDKTRNFVISVVLIGGLVWKGL